MAALTRTIAASAAGTAGLVVLTGLTFAAGAQSAGDASRMAPIEQYRMASPGEEIALARSAAPASISKDAEIMILGAHAYETAVKGTNGFVCLVERSWFASFNDPVFWNAKIRGPDCINAAAARSVLPINLERTRWVLEGLSKDEMMARTKTSAAAHAMPAPGSMGYMLSRQQYLSNEGGHWHPHMMFFQPPTALSAWGANLPGSPVLSTVSDPDAPTIFVIPVEKWSDGTPAAWGMQH